MKKLRIIFLFLPLCLLLVSCQDKEKAMAESFRKLVDEVRFNGLDYQMQYEPHAVKSMKTKKVKTSTKSLSDAERFRDHHYLTLSINGLNPGLATQHRDNYDVLSEYLNDDYRDRFSIVVNGERKPCVLHHAFFPPQNPNRVIVQLVFKDQGFTNQANYFKDDIAVIYFDKKNREEMSWSFSADDLNKFPSLNNKTKNG